MKSDDERENPQATEADIEAIRLHHALYPEQWARILGKAHPRENAPASAREVPPEQNREQRPA